MKSNILTPDQALFLECFARHRQLADAFYLTGGTALAAFYLGHRHSEDLDFFSDAEIDALALDVFLKIEREKLGVSQIDFQQSYNRNMYFLHLPAGVLKVEFTFFPFPALAAPIESNRVRVDSLLDIGVNKLFAIYQRTTARDFVDLYMIVADQGYAIAELVAKARAKFDWHIDPLQLGAQFVKARDVADLPRMIADIAPEVWREFFLAEARKLAPEILK